MAVPSTIPPQNGRPKLPGFTYAALSSVFLIAVTTIGVTVRQSPPPTVAEFAPEAVEQIKQAPDEQASETGSDGGGLEGSGPSTPTGTTSTTTTTAAPGVAPEADIEVPRVRQCVGNPPRQIEDPQSPPCVPFWEGDNRGATYQGVTQDEIRIGIPAYDGDDYYPLLEAFFNQRFEFYGRKLKFVHIGSTPGANNPEAQRALAIDADEKFKIFASGPVYEAFHYQAELARRGIISVARTPLFSERDMQRHRPYVWGYPMANDRLFANIGEWVCSRFAGKQAEHAGPLLAQRDRVFGLVFQVTSQGDNPATTDALERELEACGVSIAARVEYAGGTDTLDPAKATTSAQKMQASDVTSIICLCDSAVLGGMGRAATGQTYFPEWLTSTYIQQDISYVVRTHVPPEQREHVMGLTFLPREIPPEEHPSWQAAKQVDPGGNQYTGDPVTMTEWDIKYRGMLLLASGIQLAGPNLTPESFEQGLHRARFASPPHHTMSGAVGFSDGDHTMSNDAAEFWWSNEARDPYKDAPGAFCYVDGGARHEKGRWPSGEDPFFKGPCDSGAR